MSRPPLWCPLLSRYHVDGTLDTDAMRQHAATLRPVVDGLLMPGSTGDGWQLTDNETTDVTRLGVALARDFGFELLCGAFAATSEGILERVQRVRDAGATQIAVCAPHGDRSQAEIEDTLERVLSLGLSTALYQLPQVTGNRIAPGTAASLARRHPNFQWFKDSSGEDTVALSGELPASVVLVRGAEGDYARWLAPAGPYRGFLLSTANVFARELARILENPRAAATLSAAVSARVGDAFEAVADCQHGNAFANANKALEHILTHGTKHWHDAPAPVLHGGHRLPETALARLAKAMESRGPLTVTVATPDA